MQARDAPVVAPLLQALGVSVPSYPLLAIEPRFTQILHNEAYWSSLPVCLAHIFKKDRSNLVFYSKNGEQWSLSGLTPSEPIRFICRLISPMHRVSVAVDFTARGTYCTDDLRTALKLAVEADDDILTQHHSHAQVLTWLDEAQTIPRLFNLYRFINKDFTRAGGDT